MVRLLRGEPFTGHSQGLIMRGECSQRGLQAGAGGFVARAGCFECRAPGIARGERRTLRLCPGKLAFCCAHLFGNVAGRCR